MKTPEIILNSKLRLKNSLLRFLASRKVFSLRRLRDLRPYYSQPGMRAFWRDYPNTASAPARVIIYGLRTYERYDLAVFEKVLSDVLRFKGASVQNLICEGFLASCDGATYPESHKPFCVSCAQQRAHARRLYPNDYLLMADYITEKDRASATDAVGALSDEDLKSYEFMGVKVGEHAVSSANKYFKNKIQDHSDPRFLRSLRHNVLQGVLLVMVGKGLLEREKPTHFITLHGGYSTWGPISDFLGLHGVAIYIHNKSINRVGCFYITKAGQDLSDIIAKEVWDEVKSVPLTGPQRLDLHRHLDSVRRGVSTEYKVYDATKRDEPDAKLMGLLRSKGKKKFALYPHLFWDKAFLNNYDSLGSFFPDDIEWMLETVRFFLDKKDSLLFIKPHPGENTVADFTECGAAELIRSHFGALPDHIVIVDKKYRLKSFDLMEHDCVGIVFTSTSGLEHGFFKKPVLAAGEIHYARAGAALRVSSKEEYFRLLEQPQPLFDFVENNYAVIERYAYYYYFRQQVRIPFYKDDVWLGHCIDWAPLSDYARFVREDETMSSVAEAIIAKRHVMSIC